MPRVLICHAAIGQVPPSGSLVADRPDAAAGRPAEHDSMDPDALRRAMTWQTGPPPLCPTAEKRQRRACVSWRCDGR